MTTIGLFILAAVAFTTALALYTLHRQDRTRREVDDLWLHVAHLEIDMHYALHSDPAPDDTPPPTVGPDGPHEDGTDTPPPPPPPYPHPRKPDNPHQTHTEHTND